jgi:hypothetical protein
VEDLPENVRLFPGVTEIPALRDQSAPPSGPTSVKALFKTALKLKVGDMVVIGKLPDGSLYIGSQSDDLMHVTGLLSSAVTWMTLPEDPDYEYWDEEGPTG